MIPKAYITEWRNRVPWQFDYQIEQDLIIERSIIEIFSNEYLRDKLAFRGGTALHKVFLKSQVRYSEDIDLVQIEPGNIGPILSQIRNSLSFLGKPNYKSNVHNNTLTFKFVTEIEPVITQKLKIEINTREHFSICKLQKINYRVNSTWFTGTAEITTYSIEELLATKLRALFQRRKGRDLFDIWQAISTSDVNFEKTISIFIDYLKKEKIKISSEKFIMNIEEKLANSEFVGDTKALINPNISYNAFEAWQKIKPFLLNKF